MKIIILLLILTNLIYSDSWSYKKFLEKMKDDNDSYEESGNEYNERKLRELKEYKEREKRKKRIEEEKERNKKSLTTDLYYPMKIKGKIKHYNKNNFDSKSIIYVNNYPILIDQYEIETILLTEKKEIEAICYKKRKINYIDSVYDECQINIIY